jgi:hypothetical protein
LPNGKRSPYASFNRLMKIIGSGAKLPDVLLYLRYINNNFQKVVRPT